MFTLCNVKSKIPSNDEKIMSQNQGTSWSTNINRCRYDRDIKLALLKDLLKI